MSRQIIGSLYCTVRDGYAKSYQRTCGTMIRQTDKPDSDDLRNRLAWTPPSAHPPEFGGAKVVGAHTRPFRRVQLAGHAGVLDRHAPPPPQALRRAI